jgi:hypothetical protein
VVDIADVIGILGDDKPSGQVDGKLKELAFAAAQARDEAAEAGAKAKLLKEDLVEALKAAKLEGIELPDRTIRFKTTNSKQKTRKALMEVLGDDAGKDVWGKLPTKPYTSLDIPAPKVSEPDEE